MKILIWYFSCIIIGVCLPIEISCTNSSAVSASPELSNVVASLPSLESISSESNQSQSASEIKPLPHSSVASDETSVSKHKKHSKCPNVKTTLVLRPDKFVGIWYKVAGYPFSIVKTPSCMVSKVVDTGINSVVFENRIYSSSDGKEIQSIIGNIMLDPNGASSADFFNLNATVPNLSFLRVDYERYAIINLCIRLDGKRAERQLLILSRKPFPDQITWSRINEGLRLFNIEQGPIVKDDVQHCVEMSSERSSVSSVESLSDESNQSSNELSSSAQSTVVSAETTFLPYTNNLKCQNVKTALVLQPDKFAGLWYKVAGYPFQIVDSPYCMVSKVVNNGINSVIFENRIFNSSDGTQIQTIIGNIILDPNGASSADFINLNATVPNLNFIQIDYESYAIINLCIKIDGKGAEKEFLILSRRPFPDGKTWSQISSALQMFKIDQGPIIKNNVDFCFAKEY